MTQEEWAEIRGVLDAALEQPEETRETYVREATRDRPALRAEVETYLRVEERAGEVFALEGWVESATAAGARSLEGTLLGRYRLLREVARGGMGTVFLAERADGEFEQMAAVKLMHESLLSRSAGERFRRERQILARLTHPNIAQLLDGGVTESGHPYAVMQFIEGEQIDAYCTRKALGVAAILRLFLKVAEAVQFAHQNLVLHLDIKPDNILVDDEGEPRLLDFGISRSLADVEGVATETVRLMTPRFASPEQFGSEPLTVASDEFSLASLLYLLLTGRPAFALDGASPLEAGRLLRETRPAPASSVAPVERRAELRGDLDVILARALDRDPLRRYATVAEFATDIDRHLRHVPVTAQRDSVGYRARKFVVRHRVGFTGFLAAMVLILASLGLAVRSAIRARQQERLAEQRFEQVRKLAHSYIFDLEPMLEDIPGTVKVQSFVLKNALGYLNALAAEKPDDSLLRELGDGYRRISEVQSETGVASLSDPKAALESLKASVAIEQDLVTRHPGDLLTRAVLVRSLQSLCDRERDQFADMRDAEDHCQRAWDLGQPILAAGPRTRGYATMINVALSLGMNHGASEEGATLGDPAGALPWIARIEELARDAESVPAAEQRDHLLIENELRHAYILKANVYRDLEQPEKAREAFEQALVVSRPLVGTDRFGTIGDMVLHYTYAEFLMEHGDAQRARDVVPPARPVFAQDAADRTSRTEVADLLALHARIDLRLGDTAQGRQEEESSVQAFEALLREDPRDIEVAQQMIASLSDMGTEQALPLATRVALFQRALATAEEMRKATPEDVTMRTMVATAKLRYAEALPFPKAAAQRKALIDGAEAELQELAQAHPEVRSTQKLLLQVTALRAGQPALPAQALPGQSGA